MTKPDSSDSQGTLDITIHFEEGTDSSEKQEVPSSNTIYVRIPRKLGMQDTSLGQSRVTFVTLKPRDRSQKQFPPPTAFRKSFGEDFPVTAYTSLQDAVDKENPMGQSWSLKATLIWAIPTDRSNQLQALIEDTQASPERGMLCCSPVPDIVDPMGHSTKDNIMHQLSTLNLEKFDDGTSLPDDCHVLKLTRGATMSKKNGDIPWSTNFQLSIPATWAVKGHDPTIDGEPVELTVLVHPSLDLMSSMKRKTR